MCTCVTIPVTLRCYSPVCIRLLQVHWLYNSTSLTLVEVSCSWYKAVSQLTTQSSDTNYFWKRHNVLRVQRMRRSVFELFNKNLDRQTNKNKHYLLDDGVLLSLRIRKVESEVDHLKKSVDTKLKALHIKIDKLLNINASDESQSTITSPIDRTPSMGTLLPLHQKGSSSYSGYMVNGPQGKQTNSLPPIAFSALSNKESQVGASNLLAAIPGLADENIY